MLADFITIGRDRFGGRIGSFMVDFLVRLIFRHTLILDLPQQSWGRTCELRKCGQTLQREWVMLNEDGIEPACKYEELDPSPDLWYLEYLLYKMPSSAPAECNEC